MKVFILATVGVFVFTAGLWGVLYKYGQTIKRETRTNPFFKNHFEIIAHRGDSSEAPENTLPAFENAAKISSDIIFELDTHLTKDQQLVVFHDDSLERTTNGTGFIKEKTYNELKELDAGYNFQDENKNFSWRGKGIKIPLLSEVFDKFPNERIIVEIKANNEEISRAAFDLVKKYNRIDKTVFASKYGEVIRFERAQDANIITNAPADEILKSVMLVSLGLQALDKMPADIYCIPDKQDGTQVYSPELLKEANKRNKKVFIWTINDTQEMLRFIKANVNGIITDRPKALASLQNPLK